MIRHFVLLRFRDDVTEASKEAIYRELEALRGHIKGVEAFHAGPNISVETHLIRGFKDAFWFDFTDESVRDIYLEDAAHQAVGAKIVAHTESGADGVIVVDMKV